jgi:hypothetical protein
VQILDTNLSRHSGHTTALSNSSIVSRIPPELVTQAVEALHGYTPTVVD